MATFFYLKVLNTRLFFELKVLSKVLSKLKIEKKFTK